MPPSIAFLSNRLAAANTVARRDVLSVALVVLPHLVALGIMVWSEFGLVGKAAFLLTWGLYNFFWLALLRRPAVAATLSLAMIVVLVVLSRLKHTMIWMTANFLDLMIIDTDSISYALDVMPTLNRNIVVALALPVPVLILLWWFDNFRVRLRTSVLGFAGCLLTLTAVSLAYPQEDWVAFYSDSYVSKFSRSGVAAISELAQHGYMESEAVVTERLKLLPETTCAPATKPPHIIMVHDESSFDIRAAPGINVPADYGPYFNSFDGKQRQFIVEGAGGPSWYTEYNVLAGLSARSFGRFAYYVTRIAAGRVERGLPTALRRCGYQTFTIFPALGAFMSAKAFQTTAGVQKFFDQEALGTNRVEPDQFYFDAARRTIERERGKGPVFVYVYLAENHYPWDYRWRPDLMAQWQDLGNPPGVDEYLRRQAMTAQDYAAFLARLERDFPGEAFLVVRYGDHQPDFASTIIEPSLDAGGVAKRLMTYDPRYFTTYYAIDAINFQPVNLSSALDTIEGPYLPLIVQESAGLPLDASFAEQKKILERCHGLFYACAGGAEARRFNRLLIDAGLIKHL
jgi:phosphoglycerol transferase MdoB-like AlkP superfamily enzyme